MKQAILMSIQPQYLVDILNGKKTIEIRKTMPKCDLPIDVYLYCCKSKPFLYGCYAESDYNDMPISGFGYTTSFCAYEDEYMFYRTENFNGEIVAKFTLNVIDKIEFNENYLDFGKNDELDKMCLTYDDLVGYGKDKNLYAWHIDNLQIFDEAMELSEFHKPCIRPKMQYCPSCPKGYVYMSENEEEYYRATNGQEECETEWVCLNVVEKAPQSWQYVWVEENE